MIVSEFSKKNKDYFLKHNNIKYGKFKVLSMDSVTNKGNLMVSALCDCGVESKVCLALIVSGRLKSCKECQKIVRGVGINDADYNVAVTVDGVKRYCPYYRTWSNLLSRCYSEKVQLKHPTYRDCTVCKEWLRFSNFKAWMENQDWEGKVLDKDILGDGKLYSPDTCCFITQRVNMFVVKQTTDRELPTGVLKVNNKFMAKAKHISGDYYYLGCFSSAEEAHEKWKAFKRGILFEMRDEVGNDLVFEKLMERYS